MKKSAKLHTGKNPQKRAGSLQVTGANWSANSPPPPLVVGQWACIYLQSGCRAKYFRGDLWQLTMYIGSSKGADRTVKDSFRVVANVHLIDMFVIIINFITYR
jgi:hypothetical protein